MARFRYVLWVLAVGFIDANLAPGWAQESGDSGVVKVVREKWYVNFNYFYPGKERLAPGTYTDSKEFPTKQAALDFMNNPGQAPSGLAYDMNMGLEGPNRVEETIQVATPPANTIVQPMSNPKKADLVPIEVPKFVDAKPVKTPDGPYKFVDTYNNPLAKARTSVDLVGTRWSFFGTRQVTFGSSGSLQVADPDPSGATYLDASWTQTGDNISFRFTERMPIALVVTTITRLLMNIIGGSRVRSRATCSKGEVQRQRHAANPGTCRYGRSRGESGDEMAHFEPRHSAKP